MQAQDGSVAAMGSRAVMDVYFDGQPARVGYLGQLRVDPAWRGRRSLLRAGFRAVKELHAPDEAPFDVTAIVADNAPARRLLEAGVPGLPTYRPLADFVTCVLPTRVPPGRSGAPSPQTPGVRVERATPDRLEAIVLCLDRFARRHQLARRWTADVLRSPVRCPGLSMSDFFLAVSGGEIVGCAALWDQSAFKQVVVRGYSRPLARWRWLINAGARLVGAARLPPAGQKLAHAYVSHVAVEGDDAGVFAALLAAARREGAARGLAYVITGLAADHPLLAATHGARRYASVLYTVHWDGEPPGLSGRRVHPEVALL
jgi:hypothetical protein